MEDLFQFPQTCEFPAVLFLLFFLQKNYLSAPQSVHPHGFHCDSLRKIAAPPGDPAYRLRNFAGPLHVCHTRKARSLQVFLRL